MTDTPTGACDQSPEQRLHQAAAEWTTHPGAGPTGLIRAACQALIAGLDAPALRELAGASATDRATDIADLLTAALEQLRIPAPGTLPPGALPATGGGIARRPARNALRLAVAPVESEYADPGFQVLVYVDDLEITSAGAGLGLDPYDLLIPTNRLVATEQPRTMPIACCDCGIYGCGGTDVTIVRDGDRIHWDWSKEVPLRHGVTFPALAYDAEIARVAEDRSWETPDRTAGRLILTHLDHDRLTACGLRVAWVANQHRDPGLFRVALRLGDQYQVFVDTPWQGRSPQDLADTVIATLARRPKSWRATWHATQPAVSEPPGIASRHWRREMW